MTAQQTTTNLESELIESLKLLPLASDEKVACTTALDWACSVMSCYDIDEWDHEQVERAARIYLLDDDFRGVCAAAEAIDEAVRTLHPERE